MSSAGRQAIEALPPQNHNFPSSILELLPIDILLYRLQPKYVHGSFLIGSSRRRSFDDVLPVHPKNTCRVYIFELRRVTTAEQQRSDAFVWFPSIFFVRERLYRLGGNHGEATIQGEKFGKPLDVQQQPRWANSPINQNGCLQLMLIVC